MKRIFLAVLALVLTGVVHALAHPHIWIEARSTIVFNNDGAISAIRHQWTFDAAFSAWSIQGLDTNNDGQISTQEFDALAAENMVGLSEFDFYTFAGEGRDDVRLLPSGAARMSYDGERTTLIFTLEPQAPITISRALEIEVADPEYYAAFSFLENGAVLENAPDSCSLEVNPPKLIDEALEQRLFELGPDIVELPEDLKGAAADLANALILRCGEIAPASTATQAIEEVTKRRASPFGAPPPEKGLPVARTGFLGWINMQQQAFYGALTRALGALKNDGNAFWVLGLLSFLYGIFHAAGPGHGKVVISSYVLATRAEVRRGIGLSFVSALLQSVTAIVFVSVAAAVFNMTSLALSASADMLVMGSYALVVLLGLWLLARKLFGFGHHHGHAGHQHHHGDGAHDHTHDHSHDDHVHAITPQQTRGNWRELLGVVFAVGLRPCSGALVVLVFALSQQVYPAGIAAVFLMGIGTGLTVSVLALVAVGVNGATRLLANGPYAAFANTVVWWLELLGALLVFGFGVLLLLANL